MFLQMLLTVLFLAVFGIAEKVTVKLDGIQLKFLADALPAEYASVSPHELSLLEPLLVPRPPGSEGHKKVFEYIAAHFVKLDWKVEVDSFTATTPKGAVNFSNIIASSNPDAKRKLVLAAHYDSKMIDGIDFIGATDSAAPCAILMNVAQRLNPYLLQATDQDIGIDLIFFDGEEAFVQWSANDSIYGARHLAEKWASEMIQIKDGNLKQVGDETSSSFKSKISMIELFVLLDLLGTPDSVVPNYFSSNAASNESYLKLVDIQKRLHNSNLFSQSLSVRIKNNGGLFRAENVQTAYVEDDHLPFLKRDVSVLHVIPFPFPSVWHNAKDDHSALDQDIIRDWCLVWAVFVAEYIGIDFNTNPVYEVLNAPLPFFLNRSEAMASIAPECNELKNKYDTCFNSWYSNKFLKGIFDNECQGVFEEYKSCVNKVLKEKKLDNLIQEARKSTQSSQSTKSGESRE